MASESHQCNGFFSSRSLLFLQPSVTQPLKKPRVLLSLSLNLAPIVTTPYLQRRVESKANPSTQCVVLFCFTTFLFFMTSVFSSSSDLSLATVVCLHLVFCPHFNTLLSKCSAMELERDGLRVCRRSSTAVEFFATERAAACAASAAALAIWAAYSTVCLKFSWFTAWYLDCLLSALLPLRLETQLAQILAPSQWNIGCLFVITCCSICSFSLLNVRTCHEFKQRSNETASLDTSTCWVFFVLRTTPAFCSINICSKTLVLAWWAHGQKQTCYEFRV